MSEQLFFTLTAASIGFIAAMFLCIGSAITSSTEIRQQTADKYGFNAQRALALSAQRAQYAVGVMLLAISFCLQIAAALAFPASIVNLPQWLNTGLRLVLVELALTGLFGLGLGIALYTTTTPSAWRSTQLPK